MRIRFPHPASAFAVRTPALLAAARASRIVARETSAPLTPDERMELVAELTRAAWAMTGRPWPDQPRSKWPIRIRRLGESA